MYLISTALLENIPLYFGAVILFTQIDKKEYHFQSITLGRSSFFAFQFEGDNKAQLKEPRKP